ncbi:hypothetical protein Ciccas_000626 [Cichlidogyrus casuarinus]|uniref:Activator of Hsp90 ATPase AHSA1-like N-terminal domain-containing protein n=1 Tax=Cichlidogyrus casuarinus TaxID=1844966 RepID=A0ABD2QMM5_9PLAT
MAKWGEGDPRWIVEEREDCRNVNNWHWTEKNATGWSQKRINELLNNGIIENDDYSCKIYEVSKCEGDAVANNRKGKLIFLYEWVVECKWCGSLKKGNNKTKYEGKAEIPNLSDENTADELDVLITCDSATDEAHLLKQFMHSEGSKYIKEKLGQYIKQLKEEYSRGLILPSKTQTNPSTLSNAPNLNSATVTTPKPADAPKSKITDSSEIGKHTLELKDEFFCAPDDLYRVMTTQDLVSAFTRANASVDPKIGGSFNLWGGNITGSYTELMPGKLIEMTWRRSNWTADFYSKVKIELEAFDRGTRLKLTQTGITQAELESIRSGWYSNYFQAIKQIFGYGGSLY